MSIDFKPLFKHVTGNSIISIDTVTTPVLEGGQGNPYQGRVTKVMLGGNVMVFSNKNSNGYENWVRKRLIKEGLDPDRFELSERPWGVRVPDLPIVEHEGKQYLEVIFLKPGHVTYMLDGQPLADPSTIPGLKLKRTESHQGGLQEEHKAHLRCFNVENVLRLVIDGVEVCERGAELQK